MRKTRIADGNACPAPRTGAEESLRDINLELSALLGNLPGIAYRCASDEHWTMEYVSEGCKDLTGYAPDELINNRNLSFSVLIRPTYRHAIRQQVLKSLRTRARFELEYPIRTKSGEEKWVWERGIGVFAAHGELLALEGFITDITARKRTAEQLQRSEERLRNMVEHLPAGAVFRGENLFIVNKAVESITGYSRGELSTVDDWFRIVYGDRHLERRALYEASRKAGFPERRLLPITRKDGQSRYVEFAAYAYENGEVWLLHDITELKEAEEELRSYQNQLRSLASALSLAEDRERKRIAAALHDGLGQALSMVHVNLETIRNAPPTAKSAAILEEVRQTIDQAIKDIRSLTFELSSPVLHQMGLVPALQQLCVDLSKQYGMEFNVGVDGDTYPESLGSERKMVLFRCVRELLINAAKHAEADEANVRLSTHHQQLQIEVEDAGIGFDASEIGRKFSPSGGFGLFSLYECLKQMGGSLDIQSTPGQGTQAKIEVPLQTEPKPNAPLDDERQTND